MDPRSWPWEAIALVALLLAFGQAAVAAWRRFARRRRILARVARAGEGEEQAAAWLADRGYEILGAQVAAEYPALVDGEAMTIGVRADYLVERDGARFVVEVKTGALAPRLRTPATRRQLLEYLFAFDADGVLLVDAERERIHVVTFPWLARAPEARTSSSWGVALVVAALAVVLALVLAKVMAS